MYDAIAILRLTSFPSIFEVDGDSRTLWGLGDNNVGNDSGKLGPAGSVTPMKHDPLSGPCLIHPASQSTQTFYNQTYYNQLSLSLVSFIWSGMGSWSLRELYRQSTPCMDRRRYRQRRREGWRRRPRWRWRQRWRHKCWYKHGGRSRYMGASKIGGPKIDPNIFWSLL